MTENEAKIRISENIAYLTDELGRLSIVADAQIYEIACLCAETDPTIAARVFSEVSGKPYDSREFALFCKLYARLSKRTDISQFIVSEAAENDDFPDSSGVACMKNRYSEKALEAFSATFTVNNIVEVNSFSEACEAVNYGKAKFCILPYSNSADGVLSSLRRLIGKYDLKIVSAADIVSDDGETVTRFTLLSRIIDLRCKAPEYLEISSPVKYGEQMSRLFSAVDELGVSITQITTEPLQYSDDESLFGMVMRMNGCNIYAVFMFLFYAFPRYGLHGQYEVVNHNYKGETK